MEVIILDRRPSRDQDVKIYQKVAVFIGKVLITLIFTGLFIKI